MNGYSFAGVGYVLSCLPSMSEECLKIHQQIELIRNLKLIPDVIINIKVPLLPPVVGPSVLLPPVVGPSVLLPTSPSTWPSQHTHSIKRYTIWWYRSLGLCQPNTHHYTFKIYIDKTHFPYIHVVFHQPLKFGKWEINQQLLWGNAFA